MLIRLCCVLLLTMSLFSCTKKDTAPTKKTLHLNLGTQPPTLDPRKVSDTISSSLAKHLYDGLTRIGLNGTPELSLAASCEISEDGLSYRFTLKESYWSNGDPLTAYDFETTWKNNLSPTFPCPLAISLYCIKNGKQAKEGLIPVDKIGVRALDTQTLLVELDYPSSDFLYLLSYSCFFPYPDKIAEHNHKAPSAENIVLGPFSIKTWEANNFLLLQKNLSYWDANHVNLDQIGINFIEDQNTELSLYEEGSFDWIGAPFSSLPPDALPLLKTRKDFHTYPISGLYFYVFNTKVTPFNNRNIRKALSLALDRKELVDHVVQNGSIEALRCISPLLDTTSMTYFPDKNLSEAQEYFIKGCQELGLTEKTFPTIVLSYNTGVAIHYKIAQAIQQQWKEHLGLTVELSSQEWKVYLDALNHKNFHVARLGKAAISPDPLLMLEDFAYEDSPMNPSGWYNPEFAALIKQAKAMQHSPERVQIMHRAEKLLLEEMPIAPIFFYMNNYLKQDYVKDAVVDNFNHIDFKWADIR